MINPHQVKRKGRAKMASRVVLGVWEGMELYVGVSALGSPNPSRLQAALGT